MPTNHSSTPNSLKEERQKATFDPQELFYVISGGKKYAEVQEPHCNAAASLCTYHLYCFQLRQKFMMELERDPDFKVDDYPDLSRAEIRERTMRKVCADYLFSHTWNHSKILTCQV
jgi:acyl-CoA oxidase